VDHAEWKWEFVSDVWLYQKKYISEKSILKNSVATHESLTCCLTTHQRVDICVVMFWVFFFSLSHFIHQPSHNIVKLFFGQFTRKFGPWPKNDPKKRNRTVRRWNAKCFPLECHQSAKVCTVVVKRLGARFGLALVPDLSNYAVFIAVHDAYHGFGSVITAYSYTDRQPMARKYDIFLD